MGNSKDCHPTLIPFQPMSLSGSTRTEGMQALEKEKKQKRKTREAEMRLILGLPATGLASLVQTQFIFCSHPSPAVTTCVTVLSRKYQPDQPCYLYFGEDFPGKLFKLDLYSCVVYHPRHSNPKNCGDWTIWHFSDMQLNHCCDFHCLPMLPVEARYVQRQSI